eukprot:TRINITY_DN48154_c0_g1_i1.p1 TRINITY_DN48154_c0_g1~~TRINITY_DN48154_c0_g1_i1.p1  ORF type:complete len:363 (+),score=36.16 TRINITY_DN48154_c0_g1_i1:85-1173(+)
MDIRQPPIPTGSHAGKHFRKFCHAFTTDPVACNPYASIHKEDRSFPMPARLCFSTLVAGHLLNPQSTWRRRCRLRSTKSVSEDADVNLARLCLLGTAACWGTYPVVVKGLAMTSGGEPLDASLITVIRFTLIAVLCVPLLPPDLLNSSSKSHGTDLTALAQAATEIAGIGLAGTLLNTWGIEHTTAIRATLLLSCINITTPVLAFFFGSNMQDRNVSLQTWVGCIVSFVATAYATLGSQGEAGSLQKGDLAVVAATFCYSLSKVRLAAKVRVFNPDTFSAARLLAAAVLAYIVFAVECAVGNNPNWQIQLSSLQTTTWLLLFFGGAGARCACNCIAGKRAECCAPCTSTGNLCSCPALCRSL